MNSVIEELCRGAEWSEKDLKINASDRNRIEQCYDSLKKTLTLNQLSTLKKLMKSEYNLQQTENMRFFINGFRLGMSLNFDK